jgi:hypothetical protein
MTKVRFKATPLAYGTEIGLAIWEKECLVSFWKGG